MDNASNEIVPLREEYANAKEQLNQQTATFRAFAKEGQQMLRIILVFVGLLITAVSVAPTVVQQTIGSQTCAVYLPLTSCLKFNALTILCGITLSLSALGHGLSSGNEARAVASVGVPDDIDSTLSMELGDEQVYFRDRLNRYQNRINRNKSYLSFLENSLAIGKFMLLISIIGLTTVALALAIGPIPSQVTTLFLMVALVGCVQMVRSLPSEVVREDSISLLSLSKLINWLWEFGSSADEERK